MKVLYLSKALVVAAYRAKLDALAREAEVVAVTPRRWGARPAEPATPGAAALRFRSAWLHGRNHLHGYPGLGRLLDRERPDLVHVDEEPYSLVTLQAVRLCHARGIPALYFAWQNLDKPIPPPFGTVRRRVFASVAGGIAGTESAARVLRNAGFAGPLAVVPQFGVDERTFHCDPPARCRGRRELGLEDSDFLVGFGGRLVPEKGVHLLVRAVAASSEAHLSLAGEGPERRRLECLAREAGAADRVHFRGHLPSADMPGWLATLDALALPSLSTRRWTEQFGRILVEAMACGVPVVASRSGEMEQVVGDAGVLVPEGDEPALRAALARLSADPCARRRLTYAGRERVLAHFTQTRIATETLCFYRQILDA